MAGILLFSVVSHYSPLQGKKAILYIYAFFEEKNELKQKVCVTNTCAHNILGLKSQSLFNK